MIIIRGMNRHVTTQASRISIRLISKSPSASHALFYQIVRKYSSKKPAPPFASRTQPRAKGTSSSSKHEPTREAKSSEDLNSGKSNTVRYYGFTPTRLILISILGFCGYKAYEWQTDPRRSLVLNGRYFTPFVLESKDYVSSSSSIFNVLSVPAGQNTDNIAEAWKLGIWSVQVVQPEMQIARSYTPLPPMKGSTPEQIRLLIRQAPQGEVSRFLHRLSPGTIVHFRGPHPEYVIPENVDEIVFLAGGTGIAPALQMIHSIFQVRAVPEERQPKMRILWANRKREDSYYGADSGKAESLRGSIMDRVRATMYPGDSDKTLKSQSPSKADQPGSQSSTLQTPIVEELETLKGEHRENIDIKYFVDEEGSFITESVLRNLLSTTSTVTDGDHGDRRRIILVSGPEGFVSHFAGPKSMRSGKELQGPLGGILERINPESWSVWKL